MNTAEYASIIPKTTGDVRDGKGAGPVWSGTDPFPGSPFAAPFSRSFFGKRPLPLPRQLPTPDSASLILLLLLPGSPVLVLRHLSRRNFHVSGSQTADAIAEPTPSAAMSSQLHSLVGTKYW